MDSSCPGNHPNSRKRPISFGAPAVSLRSRPLVWIALLVLLAMPCAVSVPTSTTIPQIDDRNGNQELRQSNGATPLVSPPATTKDSNSSSSDKKSGGTRGAAAGAGTPKQGQDVSEEIQQKPPNSKRKRKQKSCRTSCPILPAGVLDQCIELCRSESGHCCGNRLNGEDPETGSGRMSCANGCEMAFYVPDVESCKRQCREGNSNEGCDFEPAFLKAIGVKKFSQCGRCWDPTCAQYHERPSGEQDCLDGCDHAATLGHFYKAYPAELPAPRTDDEGEEEDFSCDGSTPDIPRFLFAGQSNMAGISGQAKESLFREIIGAIDERRFATFSGTMEERKAQRLENKTRLIDALVDACNGAQQARKETSENMARILYNLAGRYHRAFHKDTIGEQHPTNVCSYTDPSVTAELGCEKAVSPTACGMDGTNFGPELVFAHLFPKFRDTMYHRQAIGITKVSVGGSEISHWLKRKSKRPKDVPNYWKALKQAIRADHGTIEGFVWFQGESDQVRQVPMSMEEYLDHLTRLVRDVRIEILDAYQRKRDRDRKKGIVLEQAKFNKAEDIPVVIMELGSWVGDNVAGRYGDLPGSIISAQRKFVYEVDPNAVLVNTGTNTDPNKRLSEFYHFDAASQLIMGANLASAFADHLSSMKLRSAAEASTVKPTSVGV